MTDILNRIDAVIGEERRVVLVASSKDHEDLYKGAKLILDNAKAHGDPLVKENLLIAMTKVAIQSQRTAPSKVHAKTQALIKMLDLTEEERRFMYECLFDQGGLDGPGLRIYKPAS